MEEGEGSKNVRVADASGVHVENVGSSSELSMSTISDATIKEPKTTDAERRKARKERKAAKIATREAREKKKSSGSKTRREKKLEESQESQELREGQQELKSKRRMSMMHRLVISLVARTMEMMMYHTMLQKIARK